VREIAAVLASSDLPAAMVRMQIAARVSGDGFRKRGQAAAALAVRVAILVLRPDQAARHR
jgi:hypothetical protein